MGNRLQRDHGLLRVALSALTVVFGLQAWRVLVPLIVYGYGMQPDVPYVRMGLYAFAVFLCAFLAALLRRLLTPRWALAFTAGGTALLRLAEQLSPSPSLDLVLATAGAVLFILFLPLYLGHVREQGGRGTVGYSLGLVLGLALDTGLHGLFGTYDLSWQPSWGAAVLVLALVLVQLALLVRVLRRVRPGDASDTSFPAALPFLALGPFFFLQALFFQNVARLTTITGWSLPAAFAWVILADVVAMAVATAAAGLARQRWLVAIALGAALAVALALLPLGGWGGAAAVLLGQAGAAGILTLILLGQGARADRRGLWRTTVAHGLGMFIFVLLVFAYYVGYELVLPFDNSILAPLAAAALILCGFGAAAGLAEAGLAVVPDWAVVRMALVLLLLPLIPAITWSMPQPVEGHGWPVRVMTYNLHQGFDTSGHLGLEALAQVIEESDAEVVALQEVSRGWYINGSLDMLTWLSRRLGMPYLFGPAADDVWGNAILSRYPILERGTGTLPRGGVAMERGYLWARVDLGQGEELLIIATHLYHVEEEHEVRIPQVRELVAFWDGRERTVLLGDMNSWPDSAEMDLLRQAGLYDSFAAVGSGDGYTFASNDLYQRIDYIWHSPDLRVRGLVIPQSTASDHLGVAVTVER